MAFIKYMIDYGLHPGLYNLTGELGNKFYVRNDIEHKNVPVLITLSNDKSTSYKWKIVVEESKDP